MVRAEFLSIMQRVFILLITLIYSIDPRLIFLKICPKQPSIIKPTRTRTKVAARGKIVTKATTKLDTQATLITSTISEASSIKAILDPEQSTESKNSTLAETSDKLPKSSTKAAEINSPQYSATNDAKMGESDTLVEATVNSEPINSVYIAFTTPPITEATSTQLIPIKVTTTATEVIFKSNMTIQSNSTHSSTANSVNATILLEEPLAVEIKILDSAVNETRNFTEKMANATFVVNSTIFSNTTETNINNVTIVNTTIDDNPNIKLSDNNSTVSNAPAYSKKAQNSTSALNITKPASNITQNMESKSKAEKNVTVPLENHEKTKFNYASFDCGAVVTASNDEAKHATSILSNAKDAYMLNPCDAKKYVEIELCQDILITSLRLANFEYFSSMLKNFEVFGSSKYPPTWISLGAFKGTNI